MTTPAATSTTSVTAPKPYQPTKFVSFFTAGLGGCLGWVVVHPFNTLAIRMNLASQAADATTAPKSFAAYSSNVIKSEGFMSLYSGLSAGVLRQIFYATSRFGLFEVFRDEMAKYRPTDIWSRLITVSKLLF
jgi:solute carrier family 25 (mitochondrial oxoglutarate transporter), member 11